ncbi:MAG: PA2778 family cysteine peptidase [Rhodocyclaceae bacterium]|nr:PA2778 family cysteine peptidase [Rhodocyclaceae bacterium]MDZ4213430.1 PA2778 family cysteine peptidase [Rhodocyclaceae bacterium]
MFFLVSALSGCASLVPQTMGLRDNWPQGVADRADIRDVPFFSQEEFQCGPAALATTLVHAGTAVTADDLVPRVYLPAREGSLQVDMLAAPRRYGKVAYRLAPRFDDLLREVAAGNPVIVLQDNSVGAVSAWHYAVVVGFDYPAGELYLRSGVTERLAIPFTVFEYTWKKSNYWAMVTMPPNRLPVTATEAAYPSAIAAMARVSEPADALLAYATFLVRWPGNEVASIALANLHYARGALAEAESILRHAFVQHPDSVPVANNLAHTLSEMGRNAEALELISGIGSTPGPYEAAVRDTQSSIRQSLARESADKRP